MLDSPDIGVTVSQDRVDVCSKGPSTLGALLENGRARGRPALGPGRDVDASDGSSGPLGPTHQATNPIVGHPISTVSCTSWWQAGDERPRPGGAVERASFA
jgi:hypothetical protein